jgi:GR25 family glycosyltransferase involved in LPS biosynthesis
MKIFCLNLDRAIERRACIQQEWVDNRGFDIDFFSAFDRRELDRGNFPFPYDDQETRKLIGRSMSMGEIACASSHLMLLKHAIKCGHEEIVVMEDDVMPSDNTTPERMLEVIENSKKAFPHVSVLIMHHDDGEAVTSQSINGINLLSFPPWGYRFVWLNRKAMNLLVSDLSMMHFPADFMWTKRFVPMKVLAMLEDPLAIGDHKLSYIGNEFRTGDTVFIP